MHAFHYGVCVSVRPGLSEVGGGACSREYDARLELCEQSLVERVEGEPLRQRGRDLSGGSVAFFERTRSPASPLLQPLVRRVWVLRRGSGLHRRQDRK